MEGSIPWFRPKVEGLLGQWHLRAGDTPSGLVLAACDRTFPADESLEERDEVRSIPANERCYVCQGVHAVTDRNRT